MGHVEYLNYFGRMTTNDARCTGEITSRIAMVKAVFKEKKALFTRKLDLHVRKKLVACYT
jgi:hypothetical protein